MRKKCTANEKLKKLIEKGDIDIKGIVDKDMKDTYLHSAIRLYEEELAKYLIDKGADVNVVNIYGETPLMMALHNDLDEIANMLLSKKEIDVTIQDEEGYTALHYVASCTDKVFLPIMRKIIKKGGNVNARSENGYTPLHEAINNHNIKFAEMLIKNGANVNAKTNRGWTILHEAVVNGLDTHVKLLVNNGAKVNAQFKPVPPYKPIKKIIRPLDLLIMPGSKEEILIKAGAKFSINTKVK